MIREEIRSFDNDRSNSPYIPPGPSTSYSPSPSPSVSSTPKKEKTVSSFSGGGADERKTKWGFIISIVLFFLIIASLVFPWYYTIINNKTRIYQWNGLGEYPVGKHVFFSAPTGNLLYLRPYKGLIYPNVLKLFTEVLIFLIIGAVSSIVQAVMFYLTKSGNFDRPRVLLIACLVTLLWLIVSWSLLTANFKKAYATDVDTNCFNNGSGPCLTFTGQAWGPTLGWVLAIVATVVSVVTSVDAFLIVNEAGGLLHSS